MAAERIRVLIGGNIYVKRALVRRFLEDDGYEVVAEAMSGEDLMPAVLEGQPDAVVLDDELMTHGTIAAIREAAPEARVVVFTAGPPNAGLAPEGADGYLEKGVGLAALTGLLGRLLAEPTAPIEPVVAEETAAAGEGARRSTPRLVAIVAGGILILWGVIALFASSGGGGGAAAAAAGGRDRRWHLDHRGAREQHAPRRLRHAGPAHPGPPG